jgi:hypothetical protein
VLMIPIVLLAQAGGVRTLAGDERGSPSVETRQATEAVRPTVTPVPTDPPRATTEPTATEAPRATDVPTAIPTATTTAVPSPPVTPANVQPAPPPQTGTLVTRARLCPITFNPVKPGGSALHYASQCTELPFQSWHHAELAATYTTGAKVTVSFGGQAVTYTLKVGKAIAFVSSGEGLKRMATTCESPSLPFTKVANSPYAQMTIAANETMTCTWYFKPTASMGTVSLAVWQCADGFELTGHEEMITSCTTPVANIHVRLKDDVDKDFDYYATTAPDGTIAFTAVFPKSYFLYLWPGSWDPALPAGTEMLGSCVPDVYHGMSIASPKLGWFTVPPGGAVACNVWIIPPP